jgi:hypothetical protein
MSKLQILLIKTVGTVLVVVLLTRPLWAEDGDPGVLREIIALGPVGGTIAALVFLGLVALYSRALQRTMELVRSEARTAAPTSVWWMFAIPLNFMEDFFIVRDVGSSLAADGRLERSVVRRWILVGHGWCAFQILSLFPGAAGYTGGAAAIVLWAAHWIMTARVQRVLADRRPAVPLQPQP